MSKTIEISVLKSRFGPYTALDVGGTRVGKDAGPWKVSETISVSIEQLREAIDMYEDESKESSKS